MNRIPRPQGATYLAHQFHQNPSGHNKELLIKLLINHYTINGFRYNGTPVTLDKFSNYLKIPISEVMYHISNIGTNMGQLVDHENLQNTLKTIITLATTNAIQDRGLIQTQVETLLRSQGGSYKPFISSEVTKAMKVLLDSNKNISDLYKTFFTDNSNTTNILIQGNNNKDNEGFIQTDEALKIIQDRFLLPPKADPALLPGNNTYSSQEEIDDKRQNLSELSGIGQELYDRYGVGDFESVLESRSGSEALIPNRPDSHRVTEPQGSNPEGEEALKPSSHDNSFERRGYNIQDTEELPNRE